MKKTLLASAVLFALTGTSMAENWKQPGNLDLANPPTGFNLSVPYDNLEIINNKQSGDKGLRGNLTYTLKVNQSLHISSVDSGIYLDNDVGGHNFVIDAPDILIQNVGRHSGIHVDSKNSSVTVKNFTNFEIDATGTSNGSYGGGQQGNGIRLHQGKFIKLEGEQIKINVAQRGVAVTNDGTITLAADSIDITTLGRGIEDGLYRGQAVAALGGGSIYLQAKDKIIITNKDIKPYKDEVHGLLVTNGVIEIGSLESSTQKPELIVNGRIKVDGDDNAKVAKLLINTDKSTVNGDIEATDGEFQLEGNLIFNGNKAEIANLTGNKATFTVTDVDQVVSIGNANKALTVAATGEVNDKAGIKALEGIVTGDTNGVQLIALEGMNSKETTATIDKDGNLTNIVETTNSIMSNTLDLASAAPLAMNRLLMNDVRKRMGDLRAAEGTHGVWARYDGGKLSGERSLENDFTTVQIGIDTVPVVDAPRFGVAFAYTKSDADMMRGSANMDAFSLAFYGTKFYDNGMFVDVIGRMATADTDITVDGNKKGSMDNVALSLSGELGWRFDVTEKFYFEPQAELTYTYVNADKLSLSSGDKYEFNSVDSLMARVGFAAGFKCPSNYGDVYVRASAVHEFLGDTAVMSGKNIHEVDGEDTWVEFGIGAQFNVNKNTYVYADIERTEGAKLEEDWRANVGVRYAF